MQLYGIRLRKERASPDLWVRQDDQDPISEGDAGCLYPPEKMSRAELSKLSWLTCGGGVPLLLHTKTQNVRRRGESRETIYSDQVWQMHATPYSTSTALVFAHGRHRQSTPALFGTKPQNPSQTPIIKRTK